MKVSLNWLKRYGGQGLDGPVDELVRRIGTQLGAVESVEYLGAKYQDVIIAKVVSCVRHANSDHLNVCRIDDGGVTAGVERGDDGLVQVVCGAPNVRPGLLVAWLPPGATVPESAGAEPLVLEARELRGVVSNGMLASARELALGEDHDGILELDGAHRPGERFAAAYELDDYVIELENKMFTHRPDCFGQLGVAREIAGIQGLQFTSPDWYRQQPALAAIAPALELNVSNEIPELVPRFMAVAIAGVAVADSPLWLQTYLLRAGVRPISNVVDLTNYYMLVTGQPLHAYDYDKIKALDNETGATLVVRQPHVGEQLTLLNGKTIAPRPEAILVASKTAAIGLGGVMGGSATEVDNQTTNIILECASFDMYSIRRTSMTHGIFSDAVTRNNKGQSPLQDLAVLAKVTADLVEATGGRVASEFVDVNQYAGREWVHPPVPVSAGFINDRLGSDLTADQMAALLRHVEFTVSIGGEPAQLTVTAPFWRTDIETREDVVEEIGRLNGFGNVPRHLPRRSIRPAAKNNLLELKQQVRDILVRAGANEILSYSFVPGNLLIKAGQDPAQAFQVSNALSPDLQYYRLSLTPSLLEKVHPNIKAGYDEFAIFEIGKGHNLSQPADDEGLPLEFEMLDLVYASSGKTGKPGAAFYEARAFLTVLGSRLGLELEFRPIEHEEEYQVAKPYDHQRSAQIWVKGTSIALGMIGEFKASVRQKLKLPLSCAGFGLGLLQLQQALGAAGAAYTPQPKFPRLTQDITLKVSAETLYRDVVHSLETALTAGKPEQTVTQLELLDIYQSPDDKQSKRLTFRLQIASYLKTMTDSEVSRLLDALAAAAQRDCQAERI